MSDSSGGGSGDGLSASLDALQRDLQSIREQQAAYRRFMLLAVMCIIVLMVGFGWMLFGSVKRNLNRDELASAASARWAELRPDLEAKLSNATIAAMPAYREQAMQRLPQVAPQIRQQLDAKLQAFPQRVHQELSTRVDGMLKRVAETNARDAKEIFPALSDQQAINVAERLEQEMLAQGVELNEHLDQKLQAEQQKLGEILVKFDTSSVQADDREKLEREFVHRLIQLMDYELMTDDPVYGDVEPAGLPPLPMPAMAEPSTQPIEESAQPATQPTS